MNIVGTTSLRTLSYLASRATPTTSSSWSNGLRRRPSARAPPKRPRAAASVLTAAHDAAPQRPRRGRFVDHDDARRRRDVAGVDGTGRHHRDAERREVVGPDAVVV